MTAPTGWSALVHRHAAADGRAVVTRDESWSWSELLGRAGGAAALIDELDLPVGCALPGLIDHPHTAIAMLLAGSSRARPYAPLGTRLTAGELAEIVRALDAPVLLCDPAHADLAADVTTRTGGRVVVVDALERRAPPPPPADAGQVATVLHTSGTTGRPKAVPLTEGRLAARVRTYDGIASLGPGDTFLAAAAFHHIAGLGNVVLALGSGAAVASFPRFTVEAWNALVPAGITHTLIVPAMVDALLDAGVLAAHPQLRLLIYGASPIHVDTLRAAMAAVPSAAFLQLFGQTEGSPLTALTPDDHAIAVAGRPDLLTSAGRGAPGVTVRIDQPDADGIGEVWARGAHLSVVDDEGWLHTGDLGRLDSDGYLYLSGRAGDTIDRGGELVRPVEVEDVLRTHPDVADVAVVGVPDRRLGEKVAAFVVPTAGSAPDAELLRTHTRTLLAGFKVPEVWRLIDELPRNTGGKVLRRVLVERWTSESSN